MPVQSLPGSRGPKNGFVVLDGKRRSFLYMYPCIYLWRERSIRSVESVWIDILLVHVWVAFFHASRLLEIPLDSCNGSDDIHVIGTDGKWHPINTSIRQSWVRNNIITPGMVA
jgi:hypothetical protein